MATIYYLIPDLHKKEFKLKDWLKSVLSGRGIAYFKNKVFRKHKPVGGIKVMYQHCMMLQELGYEAYPLIMGNYVGNFFGYDIELKYIKDVGYNLTEEDVIVATEFFPYEGVDFIGAKKVLFMQNWINIDKRLKKEDVNKSYIDIGYDYVMTCGSFCSEMVIKKMGIDATTITNGIDQQKFINKPEKRIPGRVLAMSRKNLADLEQITELVKRDKSDFDLKIVDGLTQAELIKEYQKADIFLVTGYPEGLPLPPLEAMNCGCVVIGFTGGGASEYMIHNETALVSEDGDCPDAAKHVKAILSDDKLKERLRAAGIIKAKSYTLANTKKMLHEFFVNITSKN
ncbi:glycosyltransferase family 4 protein [Cycloclasticus pugetii]|jgi:glycosyltransferase involved in cell wall biosynthesis|uniref:glycosyltransferase family 4 protein n=1 Tax=Cycloclasticus pugetii TaxID=34068 RepID=UPI0039E4B850